MTHRPALALIAQGRSRAAAGPLTLAFTPQAPASILKDGPAAQPLLDGQVGVLGSVPGEPSCSRSWGGAGGAD